MILQWNKWIRELFYLTLLYVDDLFVIGEDGLIVDTKRKLNAKFEMKDLGMMHYFLGMEVW